MSRKNKKRDMYEDSREPDHEHDPTPQEGFWSFAERQMTAMTTDTPTNTTDLPPVDTTPWDITSINNDIQHHDHDEDYTSTPVDLDTEHEQHDHDTHTLTTTHRDTLLPSWASSWDALTDTLKRKAADTGYAIAYYGIRLPAYTAKIAWWTLRGSAMAAWSWMQWVADSEARTVRMGLEDDKEWSQLATQIRHRERRTRGRLVISGLALLAATVGGTAGISALVETTGINASVWASLIAVPAAGILAAYGKPADKHLITTHAVERQKVPTLTADIVERAFARLNIGDDDTDTGGKRKIKIAFPSPIIRDGAGWRADIILPPGMTVSEVAKKREKLASALARPQGCVWIEGRPDLHPGHLVLWVGDQDISQAPRKPWEYLTTGRTNIFEPIELGTDPRGRPVKLVFAYAGAVIGAIPRMGKTVFMRLILLAASLDPRCEIHAYDLKGTGDLKSLLPVAHAYRAGDDDDDIEYILTDLRALVKDMKKRAKTINNLPADLCPDNKVTDALANNRSLGLHPVMVTIDECQMLFQHETHGEEATKLVTDLVKRGPATGIMVFAGTQKPSNGSLPTDIRDNVVYRFCLKVQNHIVNDVVLGTGAYKTGIDATAFSFKDKGIGYLDGEGDEPCILIGSYVNGDSAQDVVARARTIREADGRLTGIAAGDDPIDDDNPHFDLIDDIFSIWPTGETTAWNHELATRLAVLRPQHYTWHDMDDTDKTRALTTRLRETGITSIVTQIGKRIDGRVINQRGIRLETLEKLFEEHQKTTK